MLLDSNKFKREIQLIKSAAAGQILHPLRKAQIKQSLLAKIQANDSGKYEVLLSRFQQKRSSVFKYLASSLIGLSLITGTAFAANGSRPGDTLFPVKKLTEKIRVSMAMSQKAKASLQARIAQDRLSALIEAETAETKAAAINVGAGAAVKIQNTNSSSQRPNKNARSQQEQQQEQPAQPQTAAQPQTESQPNQTQLILLAPGIQTQTQIERGPISPEPKLQPLHMPQIRITQAAQQEFSEAINNLRATQQTLEQQGATAEANSINQTILELQQKSEFGQQTGGQTNQLPGQINFEGGSSLNFNP